MLTPRELRRADLQNPENQRRRAKWLAEYEAAGIAEDQDPSYVELSIPVDPNESRQEFFDRMVQTATEAMRLRRSTPDDWKP